jgi:hypothetical protein
MYTSQSCRQRYKLYFNSHVGVASCCFGYEKIFLLQNSQNPLQNSLFIGSVGKRTDRLLAVTADKVKFSAAFWLFCSVLFCNWKNQFYYLSKLDIEIGMKNKLHNISIFGNISE